MTEHERIQDQLFAYVDGELSETEQADIERHLQGCADCAHELVVTRQAGAMFKTVQPVALPEGFMARLQSRLAEVDAEDGRGAPVSEARPKLSIVPPPPPLVIDSSATPLPKTLPSLDGVPVIAPRAQRHRPILGLLAALLAAVIGVGLLLRPTAQVEDPALAPAALAYGEGEIRLERNGSSALVSQATALHVGDVVTTSANGKGVVTLGNGGSVRLAPASRLQVLALTTAAGSGQLDVKVALTEGALWVEGAGGVRCALQAGSALVVPSDSAYDAAMRGGEAAINVWSGKAALQSLAAGVSPAELLAGQQALVSGGTGPKLGRIDLRAALTNPFVLWNLYLQRPLHPTHAGPLLRPILQQTATPPAWFDAPLPALPAGDI